MQLTAEQVNDFLAKAILESQIGEAVRKATDTVLKELQKAYNNPFEQVVRNHVTTLIDKYVGEQMRPQLEAGVKSAIETVLTEEMMKKIIDAGVEKLRSRY